MKFAPRRDLWLSVTLWASVLALLACGLTPLFVGGAGIVGGMLLFLLCFTAGGFVAWLWLATCYVIGGDGLLIRTGPLSRTVPFAGISEAKTIRSVSASAATSIRRIEIRYNKYDFVHISPLDEQGFMTELKKRCPHMRTEIRRDNA
ncbi:PH domain-containing protein [Paenibacillus hodogayensis]|uniref:PH domain-containing protein n=1 Tax=Paenibacillus hodogayensis TaxID=279208 RepID=A0ABV5W765_9BACL